jgi:16S rRNA (cytosine1402-N4)-methyltransferase
VSATRSSYEHGLGFIAQFRAEGNSCAPPGPYLAEREDDRSCEQAQGGSLPLAVSDSGHTPVLLAEALAILSPRAGEVYLDCTAGLGGHSAEIAARLVPDGTVILNDADPGNVARARARVEVGAAGLRIATLHGNFADAPRRVRELGLAADMVLADLGFASSQMEDAARGLSFMREGPLDMRFDPSSPVTAAELVGTLPEGELVRILREYGEEPAAGRIARKLVEARRAGPISTTGQLAQLVRSAVGRRPERDRKTGGIDPATRTFQALRIAVNDELGSLGSLLEAIRRGATDLASGRESWLRPGARIVIISFHSLEDRPVKRAFAELVSAGLAAHLTRKPLEASEAEVSRNVRARSAKLRAVRVG